MLGSDDHEVIADEPVNENDLFGEDDNPPLLPPLSSVVEDDDGEENDEAAGGGAGGRVDEEANESGQPEKKRRRQLNRLPNLNEDWLTNPKMEGLYKVNGYFNNIRYKTGSKGDEKTNLQRILKKYEYWAQQCYPKLCFQDFVNKVEGLSGKRKIKNVLQEIRRGISQQDDDNNNEHNNLGGEDNLDNEKEQRQNNQGEQNADGIENSQRGGEAGSMNTSPQGSPENISSQAAKPSAVINEEMREMIRRKREEAIAKRKQKMEELKKSKQREQLENVVDAEKPLLIEIAENITSDMTNNAVVSPSKDVPASNDIDKSVEENVDFGINNTEKVDELIPQDGVDG